MTINSKHIGDRDSKKRPKGYQKPESSPPTASLCSEEHQAVPGRSPALPVSS